MDKLAANLANKLAIFVEAAQGPSDRLVSESFKVRSEGIRPGSMLTTRRNAPSKPSEQATYARGVLSDR